MKRVWTPVKCYLPRRGRSLLIPSPLRVLSVAQRGKRSQIRTDPYSFFYMCDCILHLTWINCRRSTIYPMLKVLKLVIQVRALHPVLRLLPIFFLLKFPALLGKLLLMCLHMTYLLSRIFMRLRRWNFYLRLPFTPNGMLLYSPRMLLAEGKCKQTWSGSVLPSIRN